MIERYLSIIEVSQKQAYIFGSNKLADNIRRSAEISWLTDPESIREIIDDRAVFDDTLNTVYSGGGHTVLTFETLEKARDFNRRYSFLLRTMNPDIEVFLFTLPYCSKVSARRMLEYVCGTENRTQDDDLEFAIKESQEKATGSECSPDQYLNELVRGLERKKSLRRASFRQGSFGIENLDANTRDIVAGRKAGALYTASGKKDEILKYVWRSEYNGSDCDAETQKRMAEKYKKLKERYEVVGSNPVPEGYAAATKFENLGGTKGDVNFLAIVHIDGNGMGARCNRFYKSLQEKYLNSEGEDEKTRWETFKAAVKAFSDGIDDDFKTALSNTFAGVGNSLKSGNLQNLSLSTDKTTGKQYFPIRGIIASGDDICFVTDGRIGIECAARFLEELATIKNTSDNKAYTASAGVAIVHQKYPFFRAYELSEDLCKNAKAFASDLRVNQLKKYEKANGADAPVPEIIKDNGAGICTIDWHLEMGEIGLSVSEIRKGYKTKDASDDTQRQLEMRPYVVVAPVDIEKPIDVRTVEPHRQYDAFRKQMELYIKEDRPQGGVSEDVQSKLKELRGILKQGETAAQYYIRFHKLKGLIVDNYYGIFENIQFRMNTDDLPLYVKTADEIERSVLFDAAEALEVYSLM